MLANHAKVWSYNFQNICGALLTLDRVICRKVNAMKETLFRENDRKEASPTESATRGN